MHFFLHLAALLNSGGKNTKIKILDGSSETIRKGAHLLLLPLEGTLSWGTSRYDVCIRGGEGVIIGKRTK